MCYNEAGRIEPGSPGRALRRGLFDVLGAGLGFERAVGRGTPRPILPIHFEVSPEGGTSMYEKEIVYDPETRDYAMYLDGELVGFARSYHEAEVVLDQLVFELMRGDRFRDVA